MFGGSSWTGTIVSTVSSSSTSSTDVTRGTSGTSFGTEDTLWVLVSIIEISGWTSTSWGVDSDISTRLTGVGISGTFRTVIGTRLTDVVSVGESTIFTWTFWGSGSSSSTSNTTWIGVTSVTFNMTSFTDFNTVIIVSV